MIKMYVKGQADTLRLVKSGLSQGFTDLGKIYFSNVEFFFFQESITFYIHDFV